MTLMYPDYFGDRYTSEKSPKNTFQVFFFELYFNKKYVEWQSMISQCIELFRNSWEEKKYKHTRKIMRQKDVEVKEEIF